MDDRITITIHLPADIDDVNAVLSAIADHWPMAKVDTSAEGGWLIRLPSREEHRDPPSPTTT